jgi:hypothetical protein
VKKINAYKPSRFDLCGVYISLIGLCLFVCGYYLATLYYPGGVQEDPMSVGFDWVRNYWCELLAKNAKNGVENPAREIALPAMFLLCVSIGIFWVQIFKKFAFAPRLRFSFQIAGVLSMCFAGFIFTEAHDSVINISGSFGVYALIGVLVGLYQRQMFKPLAFGGFALLLTLANTYIYYTGQGLFCLALLQKISFVWVLVWIASLNIWWIWSKD